jgi:MinD-like ATPase involved in chromosome partitioning or flagellar assembly
MAGIVSIHSFRGGTGKSNTTANVAALLAREGRHVAVIDTDLQSPGIHVLFGLDQDKVSHCLNDYLWGKCAIEEATHDVTPGGPGRVWLSPASIKPHDVARVMHEGYDVGRLNDGFRELINELSLDALILDTHPGLGEETMLSIAMSNSLVILLRPDQQDFEGTRVTVTVAGKLKVPRMVLVVNNTPPVFDLDEVRERVERTYGCQVAAVLPHSPELMELSSGGIFCLRYPDHPFTQLYRQVARALVP